MQHSAEQNSECTANLEIPEVVQLQQQLSSSAPEFPTELGDVKSYLTSVADRATNVLSDFMSSIPVLDLPGAPQQRRNGVAPNRVRARLRRANRRGRERAMLRMQAASFEVQLSQTEQLNSWIDEDERKIQEQDTRSHAERVQQRRDGTDYWHRTFALRRNRLRVDETQIQAVMSAIRDMLALIEREEQEDCI